MSSVPLQGFRTPSQFKPQTWGEGSKFFDTSSSEDDTDSDLISDEEIDSQETIPKRFGNETSSRPLLAKPPLRRKSTKRKIHPPKDVNYDWDKAKLEPDADLGQVDSKWIPYILAAGKIMTSIFVTLQVLFCAIVSLLFFQIGTAAIGCAGHGYDYITSAINIRNRWPHIFDELVAQPDFPANGETIVGINTDNVKLRFQFEQKNANAWVWITLMMLVFPYLFTIVWAVSKRIFSIPKENGWRIILLNITMQCLSAIGISIFSFGVLPSQNIDVIDGILFMTALGFVPSMLNLTNTTKIGINKKLLIAFNIIAFVLQLSLVVNQILSVNTKFSDPPESTTLVLKICISLPLISCAWWQNFLTSRSKFIPNKLRTFLAEYSRVELGPLASIVGSVLSIILLLTVMCIFVPPATVFSSDAFTSHQSNVTVTYQSNPMTTTTIPTASPFSNASSTFPPTNGLFSSNSTSYASFSMLTSLVDEAGWLFGMIQILASLLCFLGSVFALKILIQRVAFAFPLLVGVPLVLLSTYFVTNSPYLQRFYDITLLNMHVPPETLWKYEANAHATDILKNNTELEYWFQQFSSHDAYLLYFWLAWLISTFWLTFYAWVTPLNRVDKIDKLFWYPNYSAAFVHQSMLFNRRDPRVEVAKQRTDQQGLTNGAIGGFENAGFLMSALDPPSASESPDSSIKYPMIYVCTTMWHETRQEMQSLLRSIMKFDKYQGRKQLLRDFFPDAFKSLQLKDQDYFEFEAHVFFDDAFESHNESVQVANSYVTDFAQVLLAAAPEAYMLSDVTIKEPKQYVTPYGAQLVYKLHYKNTLVVHLKNKDKIRHRKRWSQVMYLYYLLQHKLEKLVKSTQPEEKKQELEELKKNSYILALDGDVDFEPEAVIKLFDLMNTSSKIGSVCGRIHPMGSGPIVWYQKFEYAIGHWLQKATEHVFGSVLCSPGCFSLFRAEALMDDNVMRMYAEKPEEAIHHLQRDQGEDRWLCTLLVKQGWRIEYAAAADAYTFAPEVGFSIWVPSVTRIFEGFEEFWKQRRRWTPSTMANQLDLISDRDKTIKNNDSVTRLYMWYQMFMMLSTVLGPGTIFIMLFGSLNVVFKFEVMTSFLVVFGMITFFCAICLLVDEKYQIALGFLYSVAFGLIMAAVAIALVLLTKTEGIYSPTTLFLLGIIVMFLISGILHPYEFTCLLWGILYFLAVPSAYLFLQIYSVSNLDNVSWGTREKKPTPGEAPQPPPNTQQTTVNRLTNAVTSRMPVSTNTGTIAMHCANICDLNCLPHPTSPESEVRAIRNEIGDLRNDVSGVKDAIIAKQPLQTVKKTTRFSGLNFDMPGESDLDFDDNDDQSDSVPLISHDHRVEIEDNLKQFKFYTEETPTVPTREHQFWEQLIQKYLYPLELTTQEKEETKQELKSLRNKSCLTLYLANAFFILVLSVLQWEQGCLTINWAVGENKTRTLYGCTSGGTSFHYTGYGYLQVSPVEIFVLAFFAILLIVQFFGMFWHILETWTHLMSSTDLSLFNWYRQRKLNLHDYEQLMGDVDNGFFHKMNAKFKEENPRKPSSPSVSSSDGVSFDGNLKWKQKLQTEFNEFKKMERRGNTNKISMKRRKSMHHLARILEENP